MTVPREVKISAISIFCLANMMFCNELPLPALPSITDYFYASDEVIQMTVALNLAGISLFALIHGPLSDTYGRRSVLLYSLSIYIVLTLMCPFAKSVEELSILRFLQGCSGGATTVMGLAMVHDEFSGAHTTQILSRIMLASITASVMAPIIGGHLTEYYGWYTVFFFMASYALFCWMLIYFYYTDPHKTHLGHDTQGHKFLKKLQNKWHQIFEGLNEMLHHRDFLYAVTIHGALNCGKWIYATVAPFIFIDAFGLTPVEFGYYTAAMIIAFIFCSILTEFTINKVGNIGVIRGGLSIATLGAILLLIVILLQPDNPESMAFAAALYIGGTAMLTPSGATLAMDSTKKKGSAAAILSSSRTLMGVVGAALGVFIRHDHYILMPIILLVTIAIPAYMVFQLVQRQKKHA